MPSNEEHSVSRHTSIKRARSISASLKGLFRASGSSINISNNNNPSHNASNIYSSHNEKGHNQHKSGTASPPLTPIKTSEPRRRQSLNETGTKVSKMSQVKVAELQTSRNNGIASPLPQSAMAKFSSASFTNPHNNAMSPVSLNSDLSPSQTPKLSKLGIYHNRHGAVINTNATSTTPGNNINNSTTPISPFHLPNIEKLSLAEIPSNLLYSQDSILSEEDLDQIIVNSDNDLIKPNLNDTEGDTDSAAPTPTRFTIDDILETKDRSRRPSRSRSLRKVNSSSSSISASVASSTNTEFNGNDEKKLYRGRPHAETVSATSLNKSQRSVSPHGSNKDMTQPDLTCILQTDNFKVFSNGTHEHNLKTISLVNGPNENGGKTKSMFSFSGFFKVGASNKNLDEKMESFDTSESNDSIDLNDALSLIPHHKKNFYARICASSTDFDSDEENTDESEESEKGKKRRSDHGIPEVINPKAAVSSEELKLINTLSDKIHEGFKKAALMKGNNTGKIRRKKSDSSSHDLPIDPKARPDSIDLPFAEEYGRMIGTIGHGAYGVVSVCSRPLRDTDISPLPTFTKDNKLYFAVKHLKPRSNETVEKFSTKITSEFIIGHSLSRPHKKGDKISPNISKVIDLMEVNEKFFEVMEFCPSGDLYSLLTRKYKSGSALHPLEADCFMKQLLHGIKYMHDRGIAHCDLKPENILFHPNGLLKICDFGTSCVFQTAWEKHVHWQKGAMGSEPYVAPEEFISGKEYDPRLADCWSIGVVYCTMVLGRYLWKIANPEKDSFYKSFLEEMTEENEFYVIEELKHINHDINRMRRVVLYKMFQWNPEKRITINQILQSSWMKRTRCCIPYKV